MSRLARILMLSALFIVLAVSTAFAAAATDLKAITADQQSTLQWTFATGDSIEYSLDGLTWSAPATSGSSGVRIAAGDAADGNTLIIGLTNFTNYYFRIKAADASTSNVADAFPPNEHAHRYFASDTNRCSSCHNTHTGEGANLLKTSTINDTCKTCHAGTGSKYQVDEGTVDGAGGVQLAALAGPFGKVVNSGASATPTSAHIISAAINTAPGGNPAGTGAWAEPLGCGSCHSAHPQRAGEWLVGGGGDPTAGILSKTAYQYRLLNALLPQNYDPASGKYTKAVAVQGYAITLSNKEGANYVSGINGFCGGCHSDYNTTGLASSGETKNGTYSMKTRHMVGSTGFFNTKSVVLPFEGSSVAWDGTAKANPGGTIACITCHRPHGVTTTNTDTGHDFTLPGSGTFTNTSHLLRLDNRGVCQQCHSK